MLQLVFSFLPFAIFFLSWSLISLLFDCWGWFLGFELISEFLDIILVLWDEQSIFDLVVFGDSEFGSDSWQFLVKDGQVIFQSHDLPLVKIKVHGDFHSYFVLTDNLWLLIDLFFNHHVQDNRKQIQLFNHALEVRAQGQAPTSSEFVGGAIGWWVRIEAKGALQGF